MIFTFAQKRLCVVTPAGTGILIAILSFGCFFGTETENPEAKPNLLGRLVDTAGNPVSGTRVMAIAVSASSPVDSTVTDAQGRFFFRGLPRDGYNLFGNYGRDILVSLTANVVVARTDSSKDIGTDTLRPPGHILGQVLFRAKPIAGIPVHLQAYVRFLDVSDSGGHFLIPNVPQGIYLLSYYAQSSGLVNVHDTITVRSGQIVFLPPKNLVDTIPTPGP